MEMGVATEMDNHDIRVTDLLGLMKDRKYSKVSFSLEGDTVRVSVQFSDGKGTDIIAAIDSLEPNQKLTRLLRRKA